MIAASRSGAPLPAILKDQPPLPDEFGHLIEVLARFPAPIEWGRLEAWARIRHRSFARWEIEALEVADRARQL